MRCSGIKRATPVPARAGSGLQVPAGRRTLGSVSEEIFDVVNERDEVVGQAARREVHRRGLLHRAVHVLVFNSRGEVFLQKRSMKKNE